jgi:hypothetical protein
MPRQSLKPPAARVSGWGATGSPDGKRRLLTNAQFAEMRRKRADLYEKLRQLTSPNANGGTESVQSLRGSWARAIVCLKILAK